MAQVDMSKSLGLRKATAFALLLILMAFLVQALYPYINGFFFAIILFVLLNPPYNWLTGRGVNKHLAAIFVILLSVVLVLVPLGMATYLILSEVATAQEILLDGAYLAIDYVGSVESFVPGLDLESVLREQINQVGNLVKDLFLSIVEGLAKTSVELTITYFIVFYVLVDERDLAGMAYSLIPFNEKNKELLASELARVTHSTILSTGLIALLQGVLLTLVFHVFNVPGEFFWGFICVILSVIPALGAPIIWAPAAAFYLFSGDMFTGVGVGVGGIIISSVDNLLRPFIQNRVGNIHPLITLLGVIVGISKFGVIGIIVGPLLLSYLVLGLRMYWEEHLDKQEHLQK